MIVGNIRLSLWGYNTEQWKLPPVPNQGIFLQNSSQNIESESHRWARIHKMGKFYWNYPIWPARRGMLINQILPGELDVGLTTRGVSKYSRKSWQIAKNGKFNISRKNIPRIFVDERCENNCGWKKLSANRGLEAWFFCHIMQVLRGNWPSIEFT